MEWFKTWFASPYYHLLYKSRNDEEAELFISNLLAKWQPAKDARFLDLACGAGRHAIYLNKQGYQTVGTDLSAPSIATASQSANESLDFYVQDMRSLFRIDYFDYTLNLFTSFGYFENEYDNVKTLIAAKRGLRPNGKILIDFMNAHKVKNNLVKEEIKIVDGTVFHIKRSTDNQFIYKNIQFKDKEGLHQDFTEKVQFLDLNKFESFALQAGLQIKATYGDYNLEAFDINQSDRLILELC